MFNYSEAVVNFLELYDNENELHEDLDLAIDMIAHYSQSVFIPKNVNRIFAMVHLVRKLGRQGFLTDRKVIKGLTFLHRSSN